jgi:hypothetical protein
MEITIEQDPPILDHLFALIGQYNRQLITEADLNTALAYDLDLGSFTPGWTEGGKIALMPVYYSTYPTAHFRITFHIV